MATHSGEWLTVNEAAKISNYHPEHIRRLIRGGSIQARKFSIVWMVNRDSLLAYVDSQKKQSSQTPKR